MAIPTLAERLGHPADAKLVIVSCDDLGSCHAANEGVYRALREVAPGFRQVSCVRRPIDGPSGEREADAEPVLQAIYSDGLTYVSIFIEPFNAQRHTRPMLAAMGATQTLMRRQGEWWR